YKRPVMNQKEKAVVSVFLNEVLKRSLEILKKMEESNENIGPNMTAEESRFVKEFLKGVFKRAIEVIKRENGIASTSSSDYPVQLQVQGMRLEPCVQAAVIDRLKEKMSEEIQTSLTKKIRQNRGEPQAQEESKAAVSSDKGTSASSGEGTTDIELQSFQTFITYGGKNARGAHIIYMDPKKAPRREAMSDRSKYLRLLDMLLTLTDSFIEENTNQHSFILVYRCLDEPQSKSMRFLWMVKLYGILRDRYLDKLELIVYKPGTKFKAILTMCKPFMTRELSRKLVIVADPHSFEKEQCKVFQ
ncbi:hypothetical protein QZH41_008356, partial [Actinostola sp. cb2023]